MVRRRMFRSVVHSMIAVVAVMILMAPGVRAAGDDTLKVALRFDPSTMNILEMRLGIDLPAILSLHQSLFTTHPHTGELIPSLVESYELLENPKDIRMTLYKGNRFHTGDPLTAHDVKFTYEQCGNPSNANMMAGPIDEIEDIEIIDDYTLVFHFWEPYAPWKELMWIGIASKKYFETVGPEKFRSHPVGSGIFKFKERKIGEHVILEAVDGYPLVEVEGYPVVDFQFKYLKFITVPDDVTRLAMLETGELDLVSDILPHQLKRLKRNKHVTIKTSGQIPSLYGFSANPVTDPLMADRNLGLAFRYAINRQEIVDRIFLGEGYPLYTYASRAELGHNPETVFEFDPEKAKSYLKQSSYKNQTLTLTYTNMMPNSALVAAVIQKYLKNIGINIKLQQLEEGTAATYVRNKDKRLGHLRLYAWAGERDPNIRLMLSVLSTSPYASVRDRPRKKEVDALVLAQAREMDEQKRLEILKQIHEIMTYDAVGAILFGLNTIYGMSDRIDYTWTPNTAFLFNLHMIEKKK